MEVEMKPFILCYLLVSDWKNKNSDCHFKLRLILLVLNLNSFLQNSSGKFEEGSEESVHEINTVLMESNPHALVLSTFETIWNAVNQFRSL